MFLGAAFGAISLIVLLIGSDNVQNVTPVFRKDGTRLTINPTYDNFSGSAGTYLIL